MVPRVARSNPGLYDETPLGYLMCGGRFVVVRLISLLMLVFSTGNACCLIYSTAEGSMIFFISQSAEVYKEMHGTYPKTWRELEGVMNSSLD